MARARSETDYYAVLQLPYSADATEIRQAYCRLSLVHYSDNTEQFRKVAAAYKVLCNKDQRKSYDEQRVADILATAGVRPVAPPESDTIILYPDLDAALSALDKAYEKLYAATSNATNSYFFIILDVIYNFPGKAAKVMAQNMPTPNPSDDEAMHIREAAIVLATAYDNAYHLESALAPVIGPAQPGLAAAPSSATVAVSAEHKAGTVRVITAEEAKEAAARIGNTKRAADKRLDEVFYKHHEDKVVVKFETDRGPMEKVIPYYPNCSLALALTQIAQFRFRNLDGKFKCPPEKEPKFISGGKVLDPTQSFAAHNINKMGPISLMPRDASVPLVVASPSVLSAIAPPTTGETKPTPAAPAAPLSATALLDKLKALEAQMNMSDKQQMAQLIGIIVEITQGYLESTFSTQGKKGRDVAEAVLISIKSYAGDPSLMYQQLSAEWLSGKSSPVYNTLNRVSSGVHWSALGYSYDSSDIHKLSTAVEKINTHPKKDADHLSTKKHGP